VLRRRPPAPPPWLNQPGSLPNSLSPSCGLAAGAWRGCLRSNRPFAQIVAAAAVVAVGLPADEAVMREIARWDLDVASLVIPDSDPELANAALAALLIAAGRGARRETGSFTGRTGIGRLLVT